MDWFKKNKPTVVTVVFGLAWLGLFLPFTGMLESDSDFPVILYFILGALVSFFIGYYYPAERHLKMVGVAALAQIVGIFSFMYLMSLFVAFESVAPLGYISLLVPCFFIWGLITMIMGSMTARVIARFKQKASPEKSQNTEAGP